MADKKEKRYVSDDAQLISEWDWEKNTQLVLNPYCVAQQSNKKAWWICKEGHEWHAVISHRIKGIGCPYCSNKKVLVGYNDFATTHPILAAEWHPIKNGILKPTEITHGSGIRVWWQCALGHEWQTTPNKRTTKNTSCPFCSNKKLLVGFNDLSTTHPRLANEWHPTLNGSLTPMDVSFGSSKKVWWKCQKGHEWQASISNRSKNRNCPICSKQLKTSFPEQALFYYIKKHFSDAENTNTAVISMELDIYIPSLHTAIEYDGVYYHKSANSKHREQHKNRLCNDNNIRLIRVREIGLSSYEDCICIADVNPSNPRAIGRAISEVLELLGIEEYKIDIDTDAPEILSWYLSSEHTRNLLALNPLLASEWHSVKNGELKPEHLAFNSGKKVWWVCEKGHEWQASLHNRSKGKGCPYCSGRLAIKGVNDLLTLRPDIVREWDFEQNDHVQPTEVKLGSNEKVWWICSTCGHKWKTTINARTSGRGCPKCGELKKGPKRKTHEHFAQELRIVNPNVELVDNYTVSTSKVKCKCLICKREWYALPGNLLKGKGCPECARQKRKKN